MAATPARLNPLKLGRPLKREEADERAARTMLERDLEELVRRLALSLGWLRYHTLRPKGSPAGFPDDVLVRDDRLIFAELKRQTEHPAPAQETWLDGLRRVAAAVEHTYDCEGSGGIEVYVWRPSDLLDGTIAKVLATGVAGGWSGAR